MAQGSNQSVGVDRQSVVVVAPLGDEAGDLWRFYTTPREDLHPRELRMLFDDVLYPGGHAFVVAVRQYCQAGPEAVVLEQCIHLGAIRGDPDIPAGGCDPRAEPVINGGDGQYQ